MPTKRTRKTRNRQPLRARFTQYELSAFGTRWFPASVAAESIGTRWETWQEYLTDWIDIQDQWAELFIADDPFLPWLYGPQDPSETFAAQVGERWGRAGPPADLTWGEILKELDRYSRLPKRGQR